MREYFGDVVGYGIDQPDGSMVVNGEVIQLFPPLTPSISRESSTNKPQLPDFDTLWKNHPKDKKLPSKYDNQCAIKLSYALLLSGVDMSSFNGATETITVNEKNYKVALRAYELWNWISDNFANQKAGYSTLWHSPRNGEINVARHFEGKFGIIMLKDFWGNGQGHIDLWNGNNLGYGTVRRENSYFDRSKQVILMDMSWMLLKK
jgi:hypothetical protein